MPDDATLVLCALSRKRLEMIDEDPTVVDELLEARHDQDIRGLVDFGRRGAALAKVLSTGAPELLDSLLARSGKERPGMSGRLLSANDVRRIGRALAAVDPEWVKERCDTVGGAAAKSLLDAFKQLQTLYIDAASREDAMLVVIE